MLKKAKNLVKNAFLKKNLSWLANLKFINSYNMKKKIGVSIQGVPAQWWEVLIEVCRELFDRFLKL
jgi:hypothetical protein